MMVVRDAGYAALRVLSAPWRSLARFGGSGLRILAYHGIPDGEAFLRQLSYLVRHYSPVSSVHEVAGSEKPPVWVTFDDGDPSIVDIGVDAMRQFDVKATAFVCPGVIDTDLPFWWQVVESAIADGVTVNGETIPSDEVSTLKRLPDDRRRSRVQEIRRSWEKQIDAEPERRQLTTSELRAWLDEGHSIGNHTWDHPILSTCSPREQRRQIESAHQWFVDHDMPTEMFAYPNGDWAPASEEVLAHNRYTVGLLFDHKLAGLQPGITMSRIRVNGADPINEFVAKVSGLHPAIYAKVRG